MRLSSVSLAVIGIYTMLLISAFGATPTSISLGPLSLSAVFTILIAVYFVLLLLIYPWTKLSFSLHSSYICFILLNAIWLAVGVVDLGLIQNFVVWSGMLLISLAISLWGINSKQLSKSLHQIGAFIPLALLLFLAVMLFKVSKNGTDPATPIVGVIFTAYYLSKSIETKRDWTSSFVIVAMILILAFAIGARIVVISILAMVLYHLIDQKRIFVSIVFCTSIVVFGSILLIFSSDSLGVNVGDNAIRLGQYSINSAGRYFAWGLMIESIYNAPLLGHGVDVAPELVGVARWSHPHNDYLRLVHHCGLFGLIFFLLFFAKVFKLTRESKDFCLSIMESRFVNTTSYSLIGVAVVMLTDNVITYSYVVFVLSVFVGISIAICLKNKSFSQRIEKSTPPFYLTSNSTGASV